jgi:hypothetical protein
VHLLAALPLTDRLLRDSVRLAEGPLIDLPF